MTDAGVSAVRSAFSGKVSRVQLEPRAIDRCPNGMDRGTCHGGSRSFRFSVQSSRIPVKFGRGRVWWTRARARYGQQSAGFNFELTVIHARSIHSRQLQAHVSCTVVDKGRSRFLRFSAKVYGQSVKIEPVRVWRTRTGAQYGQG